MLLHDSLTKYERQEVAIAIDKYIKSLGFALPQIITPLIEMPNDGFVLKSFLKSEIDTDSIMCQNGNLNSGIFNFSGKGDAIYDEPSSGIQKKTPVTFSGCANIVNKDERLVVLDLRITAFS